MNGFGRESDSKAPRTGAARYRLLRIPLPVLLVCILLGCGLSACSPSVDPTAVIGNLIQNSLNSFDNTITTAEQSGNVVLTDAAGYAQQTAENLMSILGTQLTEHIDQVNGDVQLAITNLGNMVNTLNTDAQDLLATMTRDGQQLLNDLPFTNKNPQVTTYTPSYIVSSPSGMVQVTVQGNFAYSVPTESKSNS